MVMRRHSRINGKITMSMPYIDAYCVIIGSVDKFRALPFIVGTYVAVPIINTIGVVHEPKRLVRCSKALRRFTFTLSLRGSNVIFSLANSDWLFEYRYWVYLQWPRELSFVAIHGHNHHNVAPFPYLHPGFQPYIKSPSNRLSVRRLLLYPEYVCQ